MIFCFMSESLGVSSLVLSFIKKLDEAARPENVAGLSYDDAKTLLYLLHQPPHMLALEDMVFCQAAMQRAWSASPPAARHRVSVSLAQNIDIEDKNGLCVYYVPSSSENNRTLQF